MVWDNPYWFLALLLIPGILWAQYRYYKQLWLPFMTYSDLTDLDSIRGNWRAYGAFAGFILQLIAVILIITALARPQEEQTYTERLVEGIDIMLVIDISSSMLAEDMQPNRLIAVKDVASEFVDRRESDRIGVVVFAREAFTLVPPTLDYALVQKQLERVDLGMTRDGTAIGMGLATAVNRLRNSDAESRVIILLTDGENNAGEIDPLTAGELASTFGIRVYTIGASSDARTAPYPVHDPIRGTRYHQIRIEIDEDMMRTIAESTGGRYFRATDNRSLSQVYREIDDLERTEFEEIVYHEYIDRHQNLLTWGIFLLFTAFLCDRWLFRIDLS
ncbi:VWA domain-containing protein [Balneolaceae bacterium ANBcel3]|nr:VWA domain-containing protein [Balneolaceae bacterium ANBcel3]